MNKLPMVCLCVLVLASIGTRGHNRGFGLPSETSKPSGEGRQWYFTFRSFIPERATSVLHWSFAGDARTFSDRNDASYRTALEIVIKEIAGVVSLNDVRKSYGETVRLSRDNKPLRRARAKGGISDPRLFGVQKGVIGLALSVQAKNPLMFNYITPAISADISVFLSRSELISVAGRVSRYPAFELTVKRAPDAVPKLLPISTPRAGASPFLLVFSRYVLVSSFLAPSAVGCLDTRLGIQTRQEGRDIGTTKRPAR